MHWLERPKQAVQAPPLSAFPWAAVLERAGGLLEGGLPDTRSREALTDVLRSFIPLLPDEAWYCRCDPDVAGAMKCRVIDTGHGHFIAYGLFEGRSPAPPTHAPPAADRVPA